MNLAEKIMKQVQTLPESKQAEVLGFVEPLRLRAGLCLSSAMRGIEEESD